MKVERKLSKLILNPDYGLYEHDGRPMCDSLQVAERFSKEHKNVLAAIREAIDTLESHPKEIEDPEATAMAEEFGRLNFKPISYRDAYGRKQPKFLMTRAGFNYIATAFTGRDAAIYKVMLLNRFDAMEVFIKDLLTAKLEHPAFTEAVMLAHEEPKHYHFSNEADMINRIVLGMSAAKYRELHGIPKGHSIRPFVSQFEIEAIGTLQRADIGMLHLISEFEERKMKLIEYYQRWLQRRAIAA